MIRHFSILLSCLLIVIPSLLFANDSKTVAIIGTGDMGDSIGPKLAKVGYRIVYGSRDPSRQSVQDLVKLTGTNAQAKKPKQAAQDADIIFLAVPWPAMEKVAQSLGDLDGKIVVDISTPSQQANDGYLESMVETSSAEMIQNWNPRSRVVKTLLAGSYVIDEPLVLGGRVTTFIAADEREAKEVVAKMVTELGLEALDAGPLRHAREIEGWARLWFVPALQKRRKGFEMATLPSNHWYCNWNDEWFEPVGDSEDLASVSAMNNHASTCPDK